MSFLGVRTCRLQHMRRSKNGYDKEGAQYQQADEKGRGESGTKTEAADKSITPQAQRTQAAAAFIIGERLLGRGE